MCCLGGKCCDKEKTQRLFTVVGSACVLAKTEGGWGRKKNNPCHSERHVAEEVRDALAVVCAPNRLGKDWGDVDNVNLVAVLELVLVRARVGDLRAQQKGGQRVCVSRGHKPNSDKALPASHQNSPPLFWGCSVHDAVSIHHPCPSSFP